MTIDKKKSTSDTATADSVFIEKTKGRIDELKAEFGAGQKMLTEMDTKHKELEATMLRISGAIQILEEIIAPHSPNA